MLLIKRYYVSVNSNWVHTPGQPPGITSKNLPKGVGIWLLKVARGPENIWQGPGFVKNESETSKNCVDQVFTGENRKNK